VTIGTHYHTMPGGGSTTDTNTGEAYDAGSFALGPHNHGISHTHATPNHSHSTPDDQHTIPGHTHGTTHAITEEAYPASHYVGLKIYHLVAGTWTWIHQVTGITADAIELDLTAYIDSPGQWRLEFISAGGQPNGGRLGIHVAGSILGVIQSS
jgi:hypothetical protein